MLRLDPPVVRPPAVAGLFYPAEPEPLRRQVAALLAAAEAPEARAPKALIAPHAGYAYSGSTAGHAFAALPPTTRRVVVIGPAHRIAPRAIALPAAGAVATPLGEVPIDPELAEAALALPGVEIDEAAHRLEHALEVELPFLQVRLERFTVLPLVIAAPPAEAVAELLDLVWRGDDTVVVVSSDLSHFHPYEEARRIDGATATAIADGAGPIAPHQACGAYAVNGLLELAAHRGLSGEIVDLTNSGDTGGGRASVVGYGAFHFHSR